MHNKHQKQNLDRAAKLLYVALAIGVAVCIGLVLGLLPPITLYISAAAILGSGLYFLFSVKKHLDGVKEIPFSSVPSLKPNPRMPRYRPKPIPNYEKQYNRHLKAPVGNFKTSSKSNQHEKLGADTLTCVGQYLSPREFARFKRSNRTLNKTLLMSQHEPTQKQLAHFSSKEQSMAEKVLSYLNACAEIKKLYPEELISACGIETLAALPVFDLNKSLARRPTNAGKKYIDYIKMEDLSFSAMRGIDTAGANRPFLVFCINNLNYPEAEPEILTIFQYDKKDTWETIGRADTWVPKGPNRGGNSTNLFNCIADILHDKHKTIELAKFEVEAIENLSNQVQP